MNSGEIKIAMMKLWKTTFCDTDDYIKLIFDNYFSIENVECEIVDGRLIAMALTIPYNFSARFSTDKCYNNHEITTLKALYLCGLAVEPKYRNNGIMTRLMQRISKRAEANGYDFLFLIPANDVLQNYYRKRGWIDMFYRVEKSINPANKNTSFLTSKNKKIKFVYLENSTDFEQIFNQKTCLKAYDFFSEFEREIVGLSIKHSKRDFEIIIQENYLSGGKVLIAVDDNAIIQGMAFCEMVDIDECNIKLILCQNEEVKILMIDELKKRYSTSSMKIYYLPNQIQNLDSNEIRLYGMALVLKPSENSIFKNLFPTVRKNSILNKNGIDANSRISSRGDLINLNANISLMLD